MAKELLFDKILTKTDIKKRLSVPTVKKRCFLDFGKLHKVEFEVTDSNGKVWNFGCTTRKKKSYPKPVLSKGWLQFVKCWQLAIGDRVIVYRMTEGHYRIEVISREFASPPIQSHDEDRATAVASYTDVDEEAPITSDSTDRTMTVASYTDVEYEATITTVSSDQAVTYDETEEEEGLYNQPVLMFEFISLKPDINEPKVDNFFELGSQKQREMEYSSILTPRNTNSMDEIPVTSLTAPYFKFL